MLGDVSGKNHVDDHNAYYPVLVLGHFDEDIVVSV